MSKTSRDAMLCAAAVLFDAFDPGPAGRPVELPDLTPALRGQVAARMHSPQFEEWSHAAARVGFCAQPIRLTGHATTVDTRTGEVVAEYATAESALGAAFVRCRNRRASVCLSCSREYAADVFHLIRAGVTGGKGVPAEVGDNPLVFATLTAPSFGPVHGTRDQPPPMPPPRQRRSLRARPPDHLPHQARPG